MAVAFIATLALASLPVVFLSSDDKPASLNLPPFEKEVYLSVSAKWAPNNCVDVTVVTNLPNGTLYWVDAEARPRGPSEDLSRPGLHCFLPASARAQFTVAAARMDHQSILCDVAKAHLEGRGFDTKGLTLEASVNPEHAFWNLIPRSKEQRQALRIGRHGSLLKGPLVTQRYHPDEHVTITNAKSKTFILEPLPMLPEDEEGERESEDE